MMEKKMKVCPQFLYHYTTINTLGFILRDRKIKFSSLINVDDKEEVDVYGTQFGKYCFVSCWTDESEESIPMWEMYADSSRGVRIKLPIQPFKTYDAGRKQYIINPESVIQDEYFYVHPYSDTFLRKVSYQEAKNMWSHDKEKYDSIIEYFGIDTYLPGYEKDKHWDFQREWRYLIQVIPTNQKVENIDNYDFIDGEEKEYILSCPDVPLKQIFLEIEDEKFEKMEILLGPKVNDIDIETVRIFRDKYCPKAKIEFSDLYNKIK